MFSLSTALEVRQAKADGTIYIRADGSVDPPTAPIRRLGDVYALSGNVNGSVVIERSNIVFDGRGFTLDGLGGRVGVNVTDGNNVTVRGVDVRECDYGIWFRSTSNSSILNNTVTGCVWMGITVHDSTWALLSDNNATNNYCGIWITESSSCTVSNNTVVGSQSYGASGLYIDHYSYNNQFFGNTFEGNFYDIYLAPYSHNNNLSGNSINDGVYINSSPDNLFLHNNLITEFQIFFAGNPSNMWDNDFEGNYWRLYNGTDSNRDGIGDVPYIIDSNNTDNYPLMGMFSDFKATSEHHVQTICNSTTSDFHFNGTAISFNVSGEDDTIGFCRILIPTALMNGTYRVFVNGTEVSYDLLPFSNAIHSYLYFTYNHSIQEVVIIPEFPSLIILPLFMAATAVVALANRRKDALKT